MKTPFNAATPALTRAQIDAIVSAGALPPDSSPSLWQSPQGALQRNVIRPCEAATRGVQVSARNAAVTAATYGCVDWYLYPDSHDSDSASEAAAFKAA
jgi:hypothetical protein